MCDHYKNIYDNDDIITWTGSRGLKTIRRLKLYTINQSTLRARAIFRSPLLEILLAEFDA